MRGLAAGWAQPWRRLTRGVWQWEKGVHRARRLSGVSTFRLHRAALAPYIMSNSSLSLPSSAAPPLRLSGPSFRALQHKPFGPPIHSRYALSRSSSFLSPACLPASLPFINPSLTCMSFGTVFLPHSHRLSRRWIRFHRVWFCIFHRKSDEFVSFLLLCRSVAKLDVSIILDYVLFSKHDLYTWNWWTLSSACSNEVDRCVRTSLSRQELSRTM